MFTCGGWRTGRPVPSSTTAFGSEIIFFFVYSKCIAFVYKSERPKMKALNFVRHLLVIFGDDSVSFSFHGVVCFLLLLSQEPRNLNTISALILHIAKICSYLTANPWRMCQIDPSGRRTIQFFHSLYILCMYFHFFINEFESEHTCILHQKENYVLKSLVQQAGGGRLQKL